MVTSEACRVTIWKTAEAEAWCRNFKYHDYLRMCEAMGVEPLLELVYNIIYTALQTQHDMDMDYE